MNGVSSADEQRRGGVRILCPVCHKKLKQNLKYDSMTRFESLAEACEELGIDKEAAIYRKLIEDCKESGIFAKSKAIDTPSKRLST